MNPIAVTNPAVEPVALDAMKLFLRIDGEDEDDLVAALIMAGRLTVERTARLSLLEQTWRWRLSAWPADRVIALPFSPFVSVAALRVATGAGAATAIDPSLYRVDLSAEPVRLLVDLAAPGPAPRSLGIEIDVVAGFGTTPDAVPAPLVLAVKRLVAYWFEHRGDEARPSLPGIPPDVLALVAPFTRPRLS